MSRKPKHSVKNRSFVSECVWQATSPTYTPPPKVKNIDKIVTPFAKIQLAAAKRLETATKGTAPNEACMQMFCIYVHGLDFSL